MRKRGEETMVQENLFESHSTAKAARSMMLPTILSSLVMVLYSISDTYFVGMLNDDIQSAAVSLASPVLISFNIANNLFGIGASSMISRGLGKKDYDIARKSASFGIYGSLIYGVLFSIFCKMFLNPLMGMLGAKQDTVGATTEYMLWAVLAGAVPSLLNVVLAYLIRAEGNALHASIGTMSGCLLNVILDPIFIMPWGLHMGAAGAGFATFISNSFACLYFLALLCIRREQTNIRLHPKYFTLKREIVMGICSVGVPASIQNLLNVTSVTVMNHFVSVYGSAAVAAVGIAQKIYMIPLQIAQGGTQGIMPLISFNYTSRRPERLEETIWFAVKLMIPCMMLTAILGWIWAGKLTGIFIKDTEIIAYGKLFLRGFCASMPFMLIDFMAVGVFQSIGLGRSALVFAVLRKIVFEIPAIFLLNRFFHEYGITYAGLISESILAVCGTVIVKNIIRDLKKQV